MKYTKNSKRVVREDLDTIIGRAWAWGFIISLISLILLLFFEYLKHRFNYLTQQN